jgi:hypothetical protein
MRREPYENLDVGRRPVGTLYHNPLDYVVPYEPDRPCLPGWQHFRYRWTRADTGESAVVTVWCRSREDFLSLLLDWNNDPACDVIHWRYKEA